MPSVYMTIRPPEATQQTPRRPNSTEQLGRLRWAVAPAIARFAGEHAFARPVLQRQQQLPDRVIVDFAGDDILSGDVVLEPPALAPAGFGVFLPTFLSSSRRADWASKVVSERGSGRA